ncbi:MAG: AAA family ATPase, partial [Bacteroidota bacterium]
MQYLFDRHQSMLRTVENLKARPLSEHIAWENPFNALLGSRGVGKTTLLLQRIIQLGLPPHESLYIELGDLYFQEYRLQDFIRQFVEGGGKYLFIDEVHRYGYGSWAQEIKQAYDLYHRELKLTFTGSSAIRILKEKADLSRRVLQHRIPGLSFREYLWLSEKKTLPILSLNEILNDHDKLANELIGDYKLKPIANLSDYYKFGYYPIYLHEPQGYLAKLNSMIELVLEADLPKVIDQGTAPYQALGRLLFAIASSAPFT